jgi:two-component system, OmpR family, phosphate regulon sensor histidine kinase PhoR
MKQSRFKFNPLVIALYMLPALVWWANLLWKNNVELYKKEVKILQLTSKVANHDQLVALPQYAQLEKKQAGKRKMIIGEGIVFFCFLLGGLWYVYRSYRRTIELNKRQNNFQLSITHELKTPIASMQLVFDTLKKHENLPTEKVQELAKMGKRESLRLLSLINDILLSAQLEREWKPNMREVNIQTLAEATVQQLQGLYPNAQFRFNIAENAQNITADEQGMGHVFNNLIENALKYSGPDAQVEIGTSKVGNQMHIAISDNGPGIADTDKLRVFEKFYRSGNEDLRETKGTGLGLFVVKQIIEAHKGTVKIKDNLPKGARFELQI